MFAVTSTLTFALLAFAEPAETSPPFQVLSYDSEKWYAARCTEETIRPTPRWDEKAESPPISPRKAIRLATKMKDSFFKDASATLLVLMDGTVPKPVETEPGGSYGAAPQLEDEAPSDRKKSPDSN